MDQKETSVLVTCGAALKAQIAELETELATIEETLKKLGKGDYRGEGDALAKVIEQAAGKTKFVTLPKDQEAAARKICGEENFGSLFDRFVTFEPCTAFPDVAARVLSEAKTKRLLALCGKPGKAGSTYIKWS